MPQSVTESYTPPAVTLDLVPYTTEAVVPGSVRFTWMGTVYEDFEGVIYRGRTSSNAGVASGTIDYESGVATMSDYVVSGNPASFTLDSLWTRKGKADPIATIAFNTELSPIKPGGLVLSVVDLAGNQLIATADINGKILAPHVYGSIDYATGLVEIQFGDFVLASSLSDEEKTEWWYDPLDVFGQRHPHVGLVLEPRRADRAALAQHHLRHQLEQGREQQLPRVLLLGHRLEPAVELYRVELALQQRAHHHRQRGLVHEALEDGAEVDHRVIGFWSWQTAIVRATGADLSVTLKSLTTSFMPSISASINSAGKSSACNTPFSAAGNRWANVADGASGNITGNSVRSFTKSAICGFQNRAVAYQLPKRVVACVGDSTFG